MKMRLTVIFALGVLALPLTGRAASVSGMQNATAATVLVLTHRHHQ